MGTKYSITQKCVEDLANAIIRQAIWDYEESLSGVQIEASSPASVMASIETFAEEQQLTGINMPDVLKKVKRTYNKEFVPYVTDNRKEIVTDWKRLKEYRYDERKQEAKHRCPLCGGILRPAKMNSSRRGRIICTGCYLSV